MSASTDGMGDRDARAPGARSSAAVLETEIALFDALLAQAGIALIPERAAGVYENMREMRRLAALLREIAADGIEPAAVFDIDAVSTLDAQIDPVGGVTR
ncbi:MAG: hypothetical protein E6Q88_02950 [Lysobacteraceae bacterium]|nr:MAG: hypothetical protein E6Q88_02950 [Xanthomonadaceae bacterium]